MRPAHAGGHGDDRPVEGRDVEHHRILALACERGHPTADVTGEGPDLLERDGVAAPISPRAGERLEIQLAVAGHDRQAHPRAVAPADQGLEQLAGGQADLLRDPDRREVVGVHRIGPQLVADVQCVQEPGRIRLHRGWFQPRRC